MFIAILSDTYIREWLLGYFNIVVSDNNDWLLSFHTLTINNAGSMNNEMCLFALLSVKFKLLASFELESKAQFYATKMLNQGRC